MDKLKELLENWEKDSHIDSTEPGKALLDIPKLHSKYLNILSHYRLLIKDADFKYKRMKKIKWEYYTGKLSEEELEEFGWEPFGNHVLKADLNNYLESDRDIAKYLAQKSLYEEIVSVCEAIMKELHSRTFQLKSFIEFEKFISGNG